MCKSVKGAAYFGSSIHVVAAFLFLLWFLFDTVISEVRIDLWRCVPPEDDPPKSYNTLVHYLNLPFKLLYYVCMCVTGIYIFRGVERNSPRVIKFALLFFVIVQVVSLSLFITINLNYWEDDKIISPSPQSLSTKPTASRLVLVGESPPQEPRDLLLLTRIRRSESQGGGESRRRNEILLKDAPNDDGNNNNNDDDDYSINIEVISHPPSGESESKSEKIPEGVDFITGINTRSQEEGGESENENNLQTTSSSAAISSGPENLVLLPSIDEDEINKNETLQGTLLLSSPETDDDETKKKKSASNGGVDYDENGVPLAFPFPMEEDEEKVIKGESQMMMETEEEKAVLESPLDILVTATTPIIPSEGSEGPPVENDDDTNNSKIGEQDDNKGSYQASKLSHNQLVTIVFQMFLVGFNAIGSVIYVIVMLLHLTSL